MTNELTIVQETENFVVKQDADGKYVRKAKFQMFSSIVPETRDQKIAYFNLLNSDDVAAPLNDHVGKQIRISDVIFNPYDKINEETGDQEFGVLSYLITPEGQAYVTSSKSVYFSLKNMFVAFGEPHYAEDEVVTVQVVKKQGQQFKYTDIKIIG